MKRWTEWYGFREESVISAVAAIGDALKVSFDQHEVHELGRVYTAECSNGDIVQVLSNYRGDSRPRPLLIRHPGYRVVVKIEGSSRREEVRRALSELEGLSRLQLAGENAPPLRIACYGWGDTPAPVAATTLGQILGVPFRRHNSVFIGIHWRAEGPGVELDVRDNFHWELYRPPGEQPEPLEPLFTDHRRLVYVEGENLDGFDRVETILQGVPGLVLLYSEIWGSPRDP